MKQIRSKNITCNSNDIESKTLLSRINKRCLSLKEIDFVLSKAKDTVSQNIKNKAAIDYARLMLLEKCGIDKAIIEDEKIKFIFTNQGRQFVSSSNLVLDTVLFHESVHAVQNHDICIRENYEENRYYILKERIIIQHIP